MDYTELSDEKLIEEAAKRLSLTAVWVTLAKVRMTHPDSRVSMRANLIKQLTLMNEYKVS